MNTIEVVDGKIVIKKLTAEEILGVVNQEKINDLRRRASRSAGV